MHTIVICLRHPDASNEFSTFLAEETSSPHIIDVDYGYSDLRDKEQFDSWAEGLYDQVDMLDKHDSPEFQKTAAEFLRTVVDTARRDYGHDED